MAKSRRARPSSNRTRPTATRDAGAPPYQSEAPAGVIDLVPVSAVSVPSRVMSPFERGVDLMSRPFGIVFVLGMAALAAFRSRRMLTLLLVVGALVSGSCRSTTIWAGVEFLPNGHLKLAAQEPYCACLTIVNVLGKDLLLRSSFHGTTLGQATLKANQNLEFRFDWAGSANDDVYEIRAVDANGNEISMKSAVHVEYQSSWISCSTASCPWSDLGLKLGQSGG